MGIRFIGEINSEILAEEFNHIDNLIDSINNIDSIHNIDGLGPKAIDSILDFFTNSNNTKIINNLKKILNIEFIKKTIKDNFFQINI